MWELVSRAGLRMGFSHILYWVLQTCIGLEGLREAVLGYCEGNDIGIEASRILTIGVTVASRRLDPLTPSIGGGEACSITSRSNGGGTGAGILPI